MARPIAFRSGREESPQYEPEPSAITKENGTIETDGSKHVEGQMTNGTEKGRKWRLFCKKVDQEN